MGAGQRDHLDVQVFVNLADAQIKTALYRRYYNEVRPHSSLKMQPPAIAAERVLDSVRASPSLHPKLGIQSLSPTPEYSS